jgi:preprotein translocase subunit SecG
VFILNIIEIIVAVLLIVLVLLQMQGQGLSGAFGGAGEFYRSKRSIERIMMWATVVSTIIFGVVSLLLLIPLR